MATLGMIIMAIGAIGGLVFWIQILIVAFKKHIGWGLEASSSHLSVWCSC